MTNLDHQLDGIWNQLKSPEAEEPWVCTAPAVQLSQGTRKKGALALCLLALTLAGKFIYFAAAAFLCGC